MAIPYLDADYLSQRTGNEFFEPQRANNGMLLLSGLEGLKSVAPSPSLLAPATSDASGILTDNETNILALTAKTFPLPSDSSNIIELSHNNEKKKFAGSTIVEDVDVMFEMMVDPNVSAILQKWRDKVYDPRSGAVGWARDYKVDAMFILFPPDGSVEKDLKQVRTIYPVKGVWPSRFARGDFDSATDDVIRITLTLTIDKVMPVALSLAEAERDITQRITLRS